MAEHYVSRGQEKKLGGRRADRSSTSRYLREKSSPFWVARSSETRRPSCVMRTTDHQKPTTQEPDRGEPTPNRAAGYCHAARCIISYRRWPSPIPMCNAFWRRAPTERLVSFAILITGVRAFE